MDVYKKYINRFPTTPETPKTANSEQINLEYEERPYLIVDLRDKDEFSTNHIVSGNLFINIIITLRPFISYIAHHYPAAMLSRCTNNESKELLIYVTFFLLYLLFNIFQVTDSRI